MTRRFFIIGGMSAVALASLRWFTFPWTKRIPTAAPGTCALAGEQIVGPYYLDKKLLRKDITEGKPGILLYLRIKILEASTCTPLEGAAVDIWHCDAMGLYSGFTKMGSELPGPPPGDSPPVAQPTDELTFLRGIQITDDSGLADFKTIYPGWYQGRATHIHFKVRINGKADDGTFTGGHTCHTGQLFTPDVLTEQIMAEPVYRDHKQHYTHQNEDFIFMDQQGADFLLKITRFKPGSFEDGLLGEVTVTVDPKKTTQMS